MIKQNLYEYLNTNKEYDTISDIKNALCSKKHYNLLHSKHIDDIEPKLAISNMLHDKLNGDFDNKYIVAPKFDRRTKQGKADAEEFDLLHGDKLHITPEQVEIVDRLYNNILSLNIIKNNNYIVTPTLFYDNNNKIKVRPSILIEPGPESNGYIIDIDLIDDVRDYSVYNHYRYNNLSLDVYINKLVYKSIYDEYPKYILFACERGSINQVKQYELTENISYDYLLESILDSDDSGYEDKIYQLIP